MLRARGLLAPLLACAVAACALDEPEEIDLGTTRSGLIRISDFGTNPGNLDLYLHVPATLATPAPVVVAMHGCNQDASDYAKVGWNALADQHGFLVLYPEEPWDYWYQGCFTWYSASSTARGAGEALSIKQMVDYAKAHYDVDASRVFATGLSSGGAMTAALLAAYPDVFAAGASMSGVAYGCATSLTASAGCMSGSVDHSAADWGEKVRQAYPAWTGPYPRLSLWQGGADGTVDAANLQELLEQWTNVHGLDTVPEASEAVGPAVHAEHRDASGRTLVETWSLAQMGHGVAIDEERSCGSAATWILDVGLCSSLHAARFFGLVVEAGPDAGQPGPDASVGEDASAPGPDAAAPADASLPGGEDAAAPGPDAAAAGLDASTQDAGAPGRDAGYRRDAGRAIDAGRKLPPVDNSCGCSSGAEALGLLAPWALLAVGVRRRRR